MPTFIDESGDCGWKDTGSKPHFAITAVWFETPEHSFTCAEEIDKLRREKLKVCSTFEFHFVRTNPLHRMAFLEAVADCSFYFVACVVRKRRDDGGWLEGRMWRNKEFLYERAIEPVVASLEEYFHLAEAAKASPLNERVLFDENDDPVYRRVLREKFRVPKAASGRSLVKTVKSGASKGSNLLQLADMVCGAIVHSFHKSDEYKKIIEAQSLGIHELP